MIKIIKKRTFKSYT